MLKCLVLILYFAIWHCEATNSGRGAVPPKGEFNGINVKFECGQPVSGWFDLWLAGGQRECINIPVEGVEFSLELEYDSPPTGEASSLQAAVHTPLLPSGVQIVDTPPTPSNGVTYLEWDAAEVVAGTHHYDKVSFDSKLVESLGSGEYKLCLQNGGSKGSKRQHFAGDFYMAHSMYDCAARNRNRRLMEHSVSSSINVVIASMSMGFSASGPMSMELSLFSAFGPNTLSGVGSGGPSGIQYSGPMPISSTFGSVAAFAEGSMSMYNSNSGPLSMELSLFSAIGSGGGSDKPTLLSGNSGFSSSINQQSIEFSDFMFSMMSTQAPTTMPTTVPTSVPSTMPSSLPTSVPSATPSSRPTSDPSSNPSATPSLLPTSVPSNVPSGNPSSNPSATPSLMPTTVPSGCPSGAPSVLPSSVPSGSPSSNPSAAPSLRPTSVPSGCPSGAPSVLPTSVPSGLPSSRPSTLPTSVPSERPSGKPSGEPSNCPSAAPSSHPSGVPSVVPSSAPSGFPSAAPSGEPTSVPSVLPTSVPSGDPSTSPSSCPSAMPTAFPSGAPSNKPSGCPSSEPSAQPSAIPSVKPSSAPSSLPSGHPSACPSGTPSGLPSGSPSSPPSSEPTCAPSSSPSGIPSVSPTSAPSSGPSVPPSALPSTSPSSLPSSSPSLAPSSNPSSLPSSAPSSVPSGFPSSAPTAAPSTSPSSTPTAGPSATPSAKPSSNPSSHPTMLPSCAPSGEPTVLPTSTPSASPSGAPSFVPTGSPSGMPSVAPSLSPSSSPSSLPSAEPSVTPSVAPSGGPTGAPSSFPSARPTDMPSTAPSSSPSGLPTTAPSTRPTDNPSSVPSMSPTGVPTDTPSCAPSSVPSSFPTLRPTNSPTSEPTGMPTAIPSPKPSAVPTQAPSAIPTKLPTPMPSAKPTLYPTPVPTFRPTPMPTLYPTNYPTMVPHAKPTGEPTGQPTSMPTTIIQRLKTLPLGSSSSYVALAGTTMSVSSSSSVPTTFSGDIGATSISVLGLHYNIEAGFTAHQGDATYVAVRNEVGAAYDDGMSRTRPAARSIPLVYGSNIVLSCGLHATSNSLSIAGNIVLDFLDDPDCIFLFQIGGALSVEAGTEMSMRNGGSTNKVFWLSETLSIKSGALVKGTFISSGAASVASAAGIAGRVFSKSSSITITEASFSAVRITAPPSFAPTSMPTVSYSDYVDKSIYSNYISMKSRYGASETTKSFSSFVYKGAAVVDGLCSNWNSLLQNGLTLPFDYLYFSKVLMYSQFDDFQSGPLRNNITASCAVEASVNSLVNTLKSARSSAGATTSAFVNTINCNGRKWKVFTCRGNVMLCIDCNLNFNNPCENACSSSSYLLSPCRSNGLSCPYVNKAVANTFQLTIGVKILYPRFNAPLAIVAARASLAVTFNVTLPGTIYCAARARGSTVSFAASIATSGYSAVVEAGNTNTTLSIANLAPESSYDVYCYTADFAAHTMPLDLVLATKREVTTQCCRSILFTSSTTEISEYRSDISTSDAVFRFKIDTLPTSSLTVSVNLTSLTCSTGFKQSTAPLVSPSSFSYSSTTKSLSNSFIIRGGEGCFSLSLYKSSGVNTYTSASIPFLRIRSLSSPPEPPIISDAYFGDQGRYVYVLLDSATDRGMTTIANYATSFLCHNLLNFTGLSGSTCLWLSNKEVRISLGTPVVGGNITLLANKVKPFCPSGVDCSQYRINTNSSKVTIRAPSDPVKPIVSLSTPRTISGCANINLDPTFSSGNGGRAWRKVELTASGAGSIGDINTFLSGFSNTNQRITIQRSLLDYGDITITLKLTNFLGGVALVAKTVTILEATAVPTVSIPGSAIVSTYRNVPISVYASASVPTCEGEVSQPLTYTWRVFSGIDYLPQYQSSSLDVRYFKLKAYQLNATTTYGLQITVSLSKDSTVTATASVNIQVLSSGVSASIKGGESRTVTTSDPYTLDATSSFDIDYPSGYGNWPVDYVWTCVEESPSYGSSCGVTLPTTGVITFSDASGLVLLPAKTYAFTVYVSNSALITSSASTKISVISTEMPSMLMGEVAAKYNPNQKILLSATVIGKFSTNATWSSSSTDIGSVALTSLSRILNPGVVGLELSLKAGSFTAGLSYTFALTAFYPQAVGEKPPPSLVTIVINSPPQGGQLSVAPIEGLALNTSFLLQTSEWSDDLEDYPLNYIISYYTTDISKQTVVKNSGIQSYIDNVLMGQGLESSDYAVTCYVSASDTYGASDFATTTVKVSPVEDPAELAAAMNSQLDSAFENANSELVSQVIGAATASLNSANCSNVPNCTELGRLDCKQTSFTCSACKDGYIGDPGDANSRCIDPSTASLARLGEPCVADVNCTSNYCGGDQVCRNPPKTCPTGDNGEICSGATNGVCNFYKSSGEMLLECSEGNLLCSAVCDCLGDFSGASCSLAPDAFTQLRSLREKMCVSIYKTLLIQDITEDVVASRATAIGDVLLNIDQISSAALTNCSTALSLTVIGAAAIDPNFIAGNPIITDTIANSLSSVLEVGSAIDPDLLSLVSEAIDAQNAAKLELAAVGEDPACSATDNLNSCASNAYGDDLAGEVYSAGQNAQDSFNAVPTTTVNMNQNTSDSNEAAVVGVAIVAQRSNPRGAATNSTSIVLSTASTSNGDIEAVIVMVNHEPMSYYSIAASSGNYTCEVTGAVYTVEVACELGTVEITCIGTEYGIVQYECPSQEFKPDCVFWSDAAGAFVSNPDCTVVAFTADNTTCNCISRPVNRRRSLSNAVMTTIGAGSPYASGGVSYTSFERDMEQFYPHHPNHVSRHMIQNRVLKYRRRMAGVASARDAMGHEFAVTESETFSTPIIVDDGWDSALAIERRRKLPLNYEELWRGDSDLSATAQIQRRRLGSATSELASQGELLATQFASRWQSITTLSLADLQQNIVIFSVILGLLCSTLAGLLFFFCVDMREIKYAARIEEESKKEKKLRKVYGFFSIILPDELSNEPWVSRLWRKLLVEHDYFCVLMPYNKDRSLRSLKWVSGMGKILNFMFVDTILAGLFFDDGGTCGLNATESACLERKSLDQYNNLCSWNEEVPGEGFCEFEGPPDEDVLSAIICTMVITVFAIPLDQVLDDSLDEIKVFVDALKVRVGGDIYSQEDMKNQEMGDELKDVETLQNTILRAARITKMKREMDDVSPEEELSNMMHNHDELDHSSKLVKKSAANLAEVAEQASLGNPTTIYEGMNTSTGAGRAKMMDRLLEARRDGEYIGQQISLIEGEDAREIYLLQQFLCNNLTGVRKYIADSILFEHLETEEEMNSKSFKRICTAIFIPLYFAMVSLYIFLFGVSIGPKSTRFWLVGCIYAFLMDIFMLQPAKIWMHKIGVTTAAGVPMQRQHAVLRDRSITVMRRTQGLMRYSSAFVQHFNPACRAARAYPELPAARLLMSLSDFDLPLNKWDSKATLWTHVADTLSMIGIGTMFTLILLPEFAQETLIEIGISALVNFLVLVAYLMSRIEVLLPVIFSLLAIALAVYYHIKSVRKRRKQQELEEQDLNHKVSLAIKVKESRKEKGKTAVQAIMSHLNINSFVQNKVAPVASSISSAMMSTKNKKNQATVQERKSIPVQTITMANNRTYNVASGENEGTKGGKSRAKATNPSSAVAWSSIVAPMGSSTVSRFFSNTSGNVKPFKVPPEGSSSLQLGSSIDVASAGMLGNESIIDCGDTIDGSLAVGEEGFANTVLDEDGNHGEASEVLVDIASKFGATVDGVRIRSSMARYLHDRSVDCDPQAETEVLLDEDIGVIETDKVKPVPPVAPSERNEGFATASATATPSATQARRDIEFLVPDDCAEIELEEDEDAEYS